ncbi:unnamed protein product, partial [Staurois parvus]
TWKCNYFSKYKLLNTFSHKQLEQSCDFYQCPAELWLKLVGGVWLGPADWPCADHLHPPKKKKTSLAIHTKLCMCRVTPHDMSYEEIRGGH